MQTPEDVAREVLGCHVETVEPGRTCSGQRYCGEHYFGWLSDVDMCPRQERLADLIHARDAEVAEQARAEALAGFEVELRDICGNCGRSPCYARCRQRIPNPQRRLVSPWEPAP